MFISCPHCQADLVIPPDLVGDRFKCAVCNGRVEVEDNDPASATHRLLKRTGWDEKDHANVHFGKSFIFGALITAAILGIFIPFANTPVGAILLKRGWVNYAEVFLFVWGMSILVMKYRLIKHQSRAAMLELFPKRIGREINSLNVGKFIDNIYKISDSLRDSLIVNRIRKALELFEARTDNGEVATFLSTQSEIDANRSAGSYAMLKVFLWAIPILGFIGTVMGLSTAVGSLAMGGNADPEALKASINSLTGGLGVAFDTTLLGLILSMIMSFPMAAVQKKEDETLTLIDAFCTEKLLPKLNDSRPGKAGRPGKNEDALPQLIASLAVTQETFLNKLEQSTEALTQISQAIQRQNFSPPPDSNSQVSNPSQGETLKTFERMLSGIELINHSLRDIRENQNTKS